jgi:hypothetical protein
MGKMLQKVTASEIDLLVRDSATEFHLVRHFKHLSNRYINSLLGKNYRYFDENEKKYVGGIITREKIQASLEMKGSKFLEGIAKVKTPKLLIELLKKKGRKLATRGELNWFDTSEGLKAHFSTKFTYFIGINAVVKISELPDEQRNNLIQEHRDIFEKDDHQVYIVQGAYTNLTDEITTIIGWPHEWERPMILTAFPGEYAPPLPNNRQSVAENEISRAFWSEHAFINF